MIPRYEIFANATNVQWVCAITVLLLCILPNESFGERGWRVAMVWAAVCGASGIPSCIFAPALLTMAWSTRSKNHLAIGLILGCCALGQIGVILISPPLSGRGLASPQIILLTIFHETILAPFLGAYLTDAIGAAVPPTHP
jgi:hypothetical protein